VTLDSIDAAFLHCFSLSTFLLNLGIVCYQTFQSERECFESYRRCLSPNPPFSVLIFNYRICAEQNYRRYFFICQDSVFLKKRVNSAFCRIDPEEKLFNEFYEISKEVGIPPKEFFGIVYKVIIGKTKGPRLADLIFSIGKEKIIKLLGQIK